MYICTISSCTLLHIFKYLIHFHDQKGADGRIKFLFLSAPSFFVHKTMMFATPPPTITCATYTVNVHVNEKIKIHWLGTHS